MRLRRAPLFEQGVWSSLVRAVGIGRERERRARWSHVRKLHEARRVPYSATTRERQLDCRKRLFIFDCCGPIRARHALEYSILGLDLCGIERQDMAQHRNRHRQQLVAVLLGQEVQLVGGCATLAKMTNEMYRVRVAQLNILHRESESSPVLHHSDVALS